MKGRIEMKKVKKLTIILTILLICLVSFIGIYVQKQSVMRNIVKDYEFGMNLEGYRELRLKVAKNEEVTSEKVQQVKEMIEKRLKEFNAQDYLIRVNYTTGEVVLELEEASNTDKIVSDIYTGGVLKMVDSKDHNNVLMTNEHIDKVSVLYNTTENGTAIYLDLKFTEEGSKKMEELSANQYKTIKKEESAEKTEETTNTDTKKEEDNQPKLTLMIDDTELVSSSFDTPITGGRLQLSLNTASTNAEKIQEAVNNGTAIAAILNNGPLPIKYEVNSNTYIYSEITEQIKMIFVLAIAVLILIALVILVIKYKMPAILAGISYIGFIALYLLVLRYANVVISLEGIAGILIILILNYLLMQKLLSKSSTMEAFKEIAIQSIPVVAVIIAFSFIKWTNIASFGMTMFWGLLLTIIYNFVVTKALLEK